MNGWSLVYEGFDPASERLRESLCTLGNGVFATRGAAAEAEVDPAHYPGTYLAGGYDRLVSEVAGQRVENEDLVNFPSWILMRVRIEDGPWLSPQKVELLEYRQELDLRRGLLLRLVRLRDGTGRVLRLAYRRFVSMAHPHLAGQELELEAEGWSGTVTVRAGIDGNVENTGVPRYLALARRHHAPLRVEPLGDAGMLVEVQTLQSAIRVAEAGQVRVLRGDAVLQVPREVFVEGALIAHDLALELGPGRPLRVQKVVSLFSSRDAAVSEPAQAAQEALLGCPSFEELRERHELAWAHLWRRCEPELRGAGEHTSGVLRLHVFHLLQTTSLHTIDLDAGIPARGWHGEAYRGHVFWDELFVFPFLNLRMPLLARSLLRYRYRRLPRARELAREAGATGALFPWQSGSDGREESQRVHLNPRSGRWVPDHTLLQRHIDAAVAYNVWRYLQVTGDCEFLHDYGAQMLLEIARFWGSYATRHEAGGFSIRGVVGPDEFHTAYPDSDRPGIDDNAYTSVMASWCLQRGLDVIEQLPDRRREELLESLRLGGDELAHWRQVSRELHVPFHADGMISQFRGYEELKELDWGHYRKKYGDIARIDRILEAENDSPNCYKVSKQPDALMLLYLFSAEELTAILAHLGHRFDAGTIPDIVEYYGKRTTHGSTLSRVVYSWVLARTDRVRSWRLFTLALESDVSDVQGGTTAEGIHLGAMAGTVDLVQRGYTGLEPRGDVLHLAPRLPRQIEGLRMTLRFRGHPLDVEITSRHVRVQSRWRGAEPVRLDVCGDEKVLHGGERVELGIAGR